MENNLLLDFLEVFCGVKKEEIQSAPPEKLQKHLLERVAIHNRTNEAFQASRKLLAIYLEQKKYVINKNFVWGYMQFEPADKSAYYSVQISLLEQRDKKLAGSLLFELRGGTKKLAPQN